jgi:hypothetical protein
MSKRLALHPIPQPNESLLSWITRIASIYGMGPEDFVVYECGIELDMHNLYILDLNPPIELLNKLSELTGIEVQDIRALTAQVYVPLLIDSLEAKDANLFNDYTNQLHVFCTRRKNITHSANGWIPWLNLKYFSGTKVCRACLSQDPEPYLRLYWKFPWMMTCPLHKSLLGRGWIYKSKTQKPNFYYDDSNTLTTPHTLDYLCDMDNITLQAVTKGTAEVPSGILHGGIWLRILRTLIEELNSLSAMVDKRAKDLMFPFWKKLGLMRREGCGRYVLFEQCEDNVRLTLMLVAASAFKSIFSNAVSFSSPSINLLRPRLIDEQDLESLYQDPMIYEKLEYIRKSKLSMRTYGQFFEYLRVLIIAMRSDPWLVRSFRDIIREKDFGGTALSRIDQYLVELGIRVDEA